MEYFIDLDKIAKQYSLTNSSQLGYKVAEFVINQTPHTIVNKLNSFAFLLRNKKFELKTDFYTGVRNGILDFSNVKTNYDSLWSAFSRISINDGEDEFVFQVKNLSIYSVNELRYVKKLIGIGNNKELIEDPHKYINDFLYLRNIYNDRITKEEIIYNLGEKKLLPILNEKLYSTFGSLGFQNSRIKKIFIIESEPVVFYRLFNYLKLQMKDQLALHDCSGNITDFDFGCKAHWFEGFHNLKSDVQIEVLEKFKSVNFENKIIIVSSKYKPDNLLVKSIFKENIFYIPNFDTIKHKLSFLFLAFLNERKSLNLDIYTERLLFENRFDVFLDKISSYTEMEYVVSNLFLDDDFNFEDHYCWYKVRRYSIAYKKEILSKDREKEEFYTDYKYKFIKKKSGVFVIVFNGQGIILENNQLDGLLYIQNILRYGNKTNGINASELASIKSKNGISEKSISEEISYGEDSTGDLKIGDQQVELIDQQTIKEIKKKIEELEGLIETELDYERKEEIENEIKRFEDYLKKSRSKSGMPRKQSTRLQNDYKKVSKAINTAYTQIKSVNEEFYQFLKKSIEYQKGKYIWKYTPTAEINWILDL